MKAVIVRFHGIILRMQPNNTGSSQRQVHWPKRVLLFKTREYRDLIGLQRMIMVRKKSKYIFIVFYNGPDKCIYVSLVFCQRKLDEKCLFVLLYITRPRGITSTIAIATGIRVVYSVVYKGDKNKSVVQKKMKFFLFVFKVLIVS